MSVQKQDHPSVKVIVTGISGTGKTTLAEKLIKRERAKWIFIYDHKQGDMARRLKIKPHYYADDLLKAAVAMTAGGILIYDPGKEFPGKKDEGFDFFSDFVWEVCQQIRGKKIFVADELQSLVDSYTKPEPLLKILDEGRTFQIDCLFIAAALNGIHNQVRKQFTEIFAFTQGDKASTEWLEENGFDQSAVMNLKNGEWLYKNKNTGEAKSGGTAFEPKNSGRDLSGL